MVQLQEFQQVSAIVFGISEKSSNLNFKILGGILEGYKKTKKWNNCKNFYFQRNGDLRKYIAKKIFLLNSFFRGLNDLKKWSGWDARRRMRGLANKYSFSQFIS